MYEKFKSYIVKSYGWNFFLDRWHPERLPDLLISQMGENERTQDLISVVYNDEASCKASGPNQRRRRRRRRKMKSSVKWIMHYSSKHNILLVGEGDFSFSVSLAETFGDATNMVATSLDSRSSAVRKYGRAEENLNTLEEYGCTVLHGVDVHSMGRNPYLKGLFFDRIVFNFPHAGCVSGYNMVESSKAQIKRHTKLVRGFLMNASTLLSRDGEIHVTHKTAHPYTEWKVEELGEEVGLELLEEVGFSKWDYPGYHNKKGYGKHTNKTFPVGCCSTFKFVQK